MKPDATFYNFRGKLKLFHKEFFLKLNAKSSKSLTAPAPADSCLLLSPRSHQKID